MSPRIYVPIQRYVWKYIEKNKGTQFYCSIQYFNGQFLCKKYYHASLFLFYFNRHRET